MSDNCNRHILQNVCNMVFPLQEVISPQLLRDVPLLFLFLSTNIFLFASQFYGNSFVDFGTCCYTYNPSIVAVAKSSIAAVLFSPISKCFICLFFLLPHKAASHTGDFYRTFFQESLSRAACLPASLELSRDFYRENFGVVKSIYSTLSSFFFTFCFIIGWATPHNSRLTA